MTNSENKPDYSPTSLDLERMNNLEIGELHTAECGFWRVLKYKDDYVLVLESARHSIFKEFKNIPDIVVFVKNL